MNDPTELGYRAPYATEPAFRFLAARAVPGLEDVEGSTYRRTIRVSGELATVEVAADTGRFTCTLSDGDEADRERVVRRCRAMFDLDADPALIVPVLAGTPELARLVHETPGRRVMGSLNGFEMVVRALLGQQVSVAGARTVLGRLVETFGEPVPDGLGLTRAFPEPQRLADDSLVELRVPDVRRQAIRLVSRAVADGELRLDPEADGEEVRERLTSIRGIGPWTAAYVAMRALRDPDVFMATDLGVRKGAEKLGLPTAPRELERVADAWKPFRSYAIQYLWAAA